MFIFETAFCLFLCFGPIVISAFCFIDWLYKRYKAQKLMRNSELMGQFCKCCMHRYLGQDYLNHCYLMDEMGMCSPSKLTCYKKK